MTRRQGKTFRYSKDDNPRDVSFSDAEVRGNNGDSAGSARLDVADNHIRYRYRNNGDVYRMRFDKITGLLALTKNIAPPEMLSNLEATIEKTPGVDIQLILPPKQKVDLECVKKVEFY